MENHKPTVTYRKRRKSPIDCKLLSLSYVYIQPIFSLSKCFFTQIFYKSMIWKTLNNSNFDFFGQKLLNKWAKTVFVEIFYHFHVYIKLVLCW